MTGNSAIGSNCNAALGGRDMAAGRRTHSSKSGTAGLAACSHGMGCRSPADLRRYGQSQAVARQIGLLNVSQSSSLPLSKPRLNQVMRWAEVPWLKVSGTA
jgi:hypothetical protein